MNWAVLIQSSEGMKKELHLLEENLSHGNEMDDHEGG